MGDGVLFILILNTFLIGFLLWFISFFGSFFYNSVFNLRKVDIFECGFISIKVPTTTLNLHFFFSAVFVILYDIELLILVPAAFNYLNNAISIYLLIFIFTLIVSTFCDIKLKLIRWSL